MPMMSTERAAIESSDSLLVGRWCFPRVAPDSRRACSQPGPPQWQTRSEWSTSLLCRDHLRSSRRDDDSTLRRTNSFAIAAARSLLPSPQRHSIATVRPSIQPISCNRCTKAATHSLPAERVLWPKSPMVGSFSPFAARAATGQAAAALPPRRVTNSRRRMPDTRAPPRSRSAAPSN